MHTKLVLKLIGKKLFTVLCPTFLFIFTNDCARVCSNVSKSNKRDTCLTAKLLKMGHYYYKPCKQFLYVFSFLLLFLS